MFFVYTFLAYIMIDFAVYGIGKSPDLTILELVTHHAKMLPVYFVGNFLISIGFASGIKNGMNATFLFGASMAIWVASLLVINIVLFKNMPNWLSLAGFIVMLAGIVLIHLSIKH